MKKLDFLNKLLTNESNKDWEYCVFFCNLFESIITPGTLLNNIIKEYVDTIKDVQNDLYQFNEVLDEELDNEWNVEWNNDFDVNDFFEDICSSSSMKLTESQLSIINKKFPPFEMHRQRTRTYKYVNRVRKPDCVDVFLFVTLLKSLFNQEEKRIVSKKHHGIKESREYLDKIITSCVYMVKHEKI